jgi:hypothetical protein
MILGQLVERKAEKKRGKKKKDQTPTVRVILPIRDITSAKSAPLCAIRGRAPKPSRMWRQAVVDPARRPQQEQEGRVTGQVPEIGSASRATTDPHRKIAIQECRRSPQARDTHVVKSHILGCTDRQGILGGCGLGPGKRQAPLDICSKTPRSDRGGARMGWAACTARCTNSIQHTYVFGGEILPWRMSLMHRCHGWVGHDAIRHVISCSFCSLSLPCIGLRQSLSRPVSHLPGKRDAKCAACVPPV